MYDLFLINPFMADVRVFHDKYRFNYVTSGHGYMPLFAIALVPYARQHGFIVKFLDMELFSADDEKRLLEIYAPFARFVGISVNTAQVPQALAITKQIRKIAPLASIIWGGVHPTLLPEQTVRHPEIDYVIMGEGEEPLVYLLKGKDHPRIVTKQKKPDLSIRHMHVPIEDLPDPDYCALEIDRYFMFQGSFRNCDVLTSRGCPFKCSFCINTILENRWRSISAERSIAIVRKLHDIYKARHVFFMDENFFGQFDRARAIIEEINRIDLTWEANICARDILKIDDSFLELIRKSGVVRLRLGAETASDRLLEILNKKTTKSQIVEARDRCLSFGITPSMSFMINLPDELPEEREATIKLAEECVELGAVIIGPQPFRPYPGSIEYNKLVSRGLSIPQSLEEWCSSDLFNVGIADQSLRNRLRVLYKKIFPSGKI